MPYSRVSCKGSESWCKKACPPVWKSGGSKAKNSPSNPSATWYRGQEVTVEWHKNNHEGGFYRRSLVPVKHMFSTSWHEKTAFDFGCWTQGSFQCGKAKACGTDKKGRAYRNKMTVPKVVPNGDYVFAMVWYGGLDYKRSKAMFSDYTSCAYVRIRDGPLEMSHKPIFQAGANKPKGVPAGTCESTSSFVLQCGGGPCNGKKPFTGKPGEFKNGGSPPNVLLSQYDRNAMANVSPKESSKIDEMKALAEESEDMKEDENMVRAEEMEKMKTKKYEGGRNQQKNDSQVQESNNSNRNASKKSSNKNKQSPLCRGNGPRKTRGSWGRRNSRKWKRMRRMHLARLNFCRKCRGRSKC